MSRFNKRTTIFLVIQLQLALSGAAGASDRFPFRVALEDVPGVAEITSGDLRKGIELLNRELARDGVAKGPVLATLCGAYIMDSSLDDAEVACAEAVASFPSEAAYNNRGVLRTFRGDLEGAKRDFDRVRPRRVDEYLEYLKTADAKLIAYANHGLVQELAARHSRAGIESSVAMSRGARIEQFEK